ncbi:MAG: hypothetical protein BWY08_00115 [Bacteroidetes bacterium ADurb.Bin174]|jgi:predicted RNase H-like HicB family nuclease|nr:MAG: hypothetical protein BWY08_00115 [Bacteroidetes bacterium ADurb.Bin174]
MRTTALIEKGKDGTFGIFTPDIETTIIGEGTTVAEAKADFENSVQEIINAYREAGDELPAELKDIHFVYKYDIASLFDYYSFINVSKFAQVAGINASLMRQYRMGQYISENQMRKIETTLHNVGKELSSIKLV